LFLVRLLREGRYRRYVTAGLADPAAGASPLDAAWQGLVLGSPEFVSRIKCRLSESTSPTGGGFPPRRLSGLDRQAVYDAVLKHFGRSADALSRRGARDPCRGLAAYLVRRTTDASLRELARDLGLSRPDSVPNLTRRVANALATSPGLRDDLRAIEESLRGSQETKNKA
jgi:hypothetical protein